MLDHVIKGGTIVDGSGGAPVRGDVAVKDGRIVQVGGTITDAATETIDADGAIVTPGWVDVHTHYDGQVSWDEVMDPSAGNGVTTIVMGNCGVGFAPVRPGGEKSLIELMEGVEDIPGTALYEGIEWGAWETFPEYLDYIAGREYSLDVGAQIAHGALRYYVMGERGSDNEDATADDLAGDGRSSSRRPWPPAPSDSARRARSGTDRCGDHRFPARSRPTRNSSRSRWR